MSEKTPFAIERQLILYKQRKLFEQAHLRVTRASGEEQSDPAGWSLVKRRQESACLQVSLYIYFFQTPIIHHRVLSSLPKSPFSALSYGEELPQNIDTSII